MSIKRQVKAEEKRLSKKNCIVCSDPADFCMRGLPENTYCRPCAKDYFKLLGYLDKITVK